MIARNPDICLPTSPVTTGVYLTTARVVRWARGLATLVVVVAALVLARLYVDESREPRVVALMYHRFVTDDEFRNIHGAERIYSMPVSKFERQLAQLKYDGYRAVSMAQVLAFVRGEADLPQPAVLITIDDGCRSALTRAAPLLRRFGFRAALFVTADPSAQVFDQGGEQARLSDDELCGLDKNVFELGAHGVHHRPLRDLSDANLLAELRESRVALQQISGRDIHFMAVPGNWYDERVLSQARAAGFEAVCLSDPGAIRPGDDPLRLPRINIAGHHAVESFAGVITPMDIAKRRWTLLAARLPERVLGPDLSRRIRAMVPEGVGLGGALATAAIGVLLAWVIPVAWRKAARRRQSTMMSSSRETLMTASR